MRRWIDLLDSARPRLPLAAHVVRFFRPKTGLLVQTDSEAPAGAGISGSSALLIAAVSALNRLNGARHSLEKIREIAQNIEAQILRVPTGVQDYYPAMYGGVSAIELGPAGIRRTPIPVDLEDFNARIVLAYTGAPRNSGINNWEVTKAHIDGNRQVPQELRANRRDRVCDAGGAGARRLERVRAVAARRMVASPEERAGDHDAGDRSPDRDRATRRRRQAPKCAGRAGADASSSWWSAARKTESPGRLADAGAEVLPVKVATRGVTVRVVQGRLSGDVAASFARRCERDVGRRRAGAGSNRMSGAGSRLLRWRAGSNRRGARSTPRHPNAAARGFVQIANDYLFGELGVSRQSRPSTTTRATVVSTRCWSGASGCPLPCRWSTSR